MFKKEQSLQTHQIKTQNLYEAVVTSPCFLLAAAETSAALGTIHSNLHNKNVANAPFPQTSGQDYLLLEFGHIQVTVSKVDGGVGVENLNPLVFRSLGNKHKSYSRFRPTADAGLELKLSHLKLTSSYWFTS